MYSSTVARMAIGHSQCRHAGGGGGAVRTGLSPGGGGIGRLLMAHSYVSMRRRWYSAPAGSAPAAAAGSAPVLAKSQPAASGLPAIVRILLVVSAMRCCVLASELIEQRQHLILAVQDVDLLPGHL